MSRARGGEGRAAGQSSNSKKIQYFEGFFKGNGNVIDARERFMAFVMYVTKEGEDFSASPEFEELSKKAELLLDAIEHHAATGSKTSIFSPTSNTGKAFDALGDAFMAAVQAGIIEDGHRSAGEFAADCQEATSQFYALLVDKRQAQVAYYATNGSPPWGTSTGRST